MILIKKTSKKAEATHPTLAIVAAFIALFVLILVFALIFFGGSDITNKIKILLPGFNSTQTNATKSEIIGYNVVQDKAKYYDGLQWLEFPEKLRIRNTELTPEQVKKTFVDYYYNTEKRDKNIRIRLPAEIYTLYTEEELRKAPQIPGVFDIAYFWIIPPEQRCKNWGNAAAVLIDREHNLINNFKIDPIICDYKYNGFGIFLLDLSNNLKFINRATSFETEKEIPKNAETYKTIYSSLTSWRDSIFSAPMNIPEFGDYCVTRFEIPNSQLLTVDLSKPTKEKTCPIA